MSTHGHDARERRSTSHLILIDGDRVLLEGRDDGWRLPVVATRGHWHAEVAPVLAALRERTGMDASVLRYLRADVDRDANAAEVVYTLEARGGGVRDGSAWHALSDARGLLGTSDAEAIDAALDDRATTHALRPPWMIAGWRDRALDWCADQLGDHGRNVTAPAEQVKHWSIASIWRMPTSSGDAWFKAVPPMFAHEGAVLELIGPTMPDHLPAIISHDPARGWSLMESIPQSTLRGADSAQHDEALRLLARLQVDWIARTDGLTGAGCGDRRLATLPAAFDELLADPAVERTLSAEQFAQLPALRPRLPAMVDALVSCGVPETLVHGDFHPANVAADGERLVLFDWTDACIGHPFFDLATYLPEDPVERAALWEAYLDGWRRAGVHADLDRAAELSEALASLHHAASYARILRNIAPTLRGEVDSGLDGWLLRLLALTGGAG